MDLSVNIAIGSSAQIALFVAPVLVLLSFFVGPYPMALVFNGFELGGDPPRGPDRQPGHARGRVDLVRGRSSCSRSTSCSGSPSSSPDARCVSRAAARRLIAVVVGLLLGRPALLRARPRADVPRGRRAGAIGWLVLSLLVGAGRARCSTTRRRRRHLHDRLPHRALAVARQPLRLPPAVRVLRRAAASTAARLLFWGIVAALVLRGAGDPRRRRADRALPLRHLRARRAAARARLADPARASRRTSTPTATSWCGWCGGSSRSRATSTARSWFVARDGHALRDAAVRLPGGDRRRRHRVRGRLDPGGVRDHRATRC